ncbi:hypothetical protein HD_0238 [[Haemophilus] ducreyi 35000HP]|uniref:Uncharacterized protein n=1 Tax=Haemophilus ducreyi (strain 35000HP / ATCC 700724) TaxID=233412 RepID=Q7VP63_HAEDU|nr:hypothetical protein HD_0238 [[Haemophilus] ducreyi 35000HP]
MNIAQASGLKLQVFCKVRPLAFFYLSLLNKLTKQLAHYLTNL